MLNSVLKILTFLLIIEEWKSYNAIDPCFLQIRIAFSGPTSVHYTWSIYWKPLLALTQDPQSCSAQRPTSVCTWMVSQVGMILRGKEENEKLHFVDSGSLFEILRKLDEIQDWLFMRRQRAKRYKQWHCSWEKNQMRAFSTCSNRVLSKLAQSTSIHFKPSKYLVREKAKAKLQSI